MGYEPGCNCNYPETGDEITFAILYNNQIINLDISPPIIYATDVGAIEINPSYAQHEIIYTSEEGDTLVFGCLDELAFNYDLNAKFDDGSCSYTCPGFSADVIITTSIFANEVYWEITNTYNGNIVASGGGGDYENDSEYITSLCLDPGTYTMSTYDTWGDGWNGGTYSIEANCIDDNDSFSYNVINNSGLSPSNN